MSVGVGDGVSVAVGDDVGVADSVGVAGAVVGAVRDGTAGAVHPLENVAASPFRFEVDGLALHRLLTEIEDAGDEIGAIYHSHTRTKAYPSQTDINLASGWPDSVYIIVSLENADDPDVQGFWIREGQVDVVDLQAQ